MVHEMWASCDAAIFVSRKGAKGEPRAQRKEGKQEWLTISNIPNVELILYAFAYSVFPLRLCVKSYLRLREFGETKKACCNCNRLLKNMLFVLP
jgi:hypothetical protein